MKKTKNFIFAVATMILAACSSKSQLATDPVADSGRTERTENLLVSLKQMAAGGNYMFGHQDDTVYGIGWVGDDDCSDVESVCGDKPAMLGFDLGHLELGDSMNLDGVPFSRIRREIIRHFERGGMVTLSWHLDNPLSGGTSWVADSKREQETHTVEAVLEGGAKHEQFVGWIDCVADFLNSLETADGVKVPVVFRPWHEHTGSWFWWGLHHCTSEQYKALWKLTVQRLRKRGVVNALYAFSPNTMNDASVANYMERYPGDDLIDLIGYDQYCPASVGDTIAVSAFAADLDRNLGYICEAARQHGKAVALTETGFESLKTADWWTHTLAPVLARHPVSYVLVWRNAHDKPGHFFAPYPGQASASDFVTFYNDPKTLFLKDLDGLYMNAPSATTSDSGQRETADGFVSQRDGRLWLNGHEYRFVGTNFWYGPILGSEGQGGNRKRLLRELDELHRLGLDNLRILVGSDGEEGVTTKVEPTLQKAPGVYNDTLLAGLDFLLAEMGKRQMKGVLYLNNAWEWSGGFGYYLEHAGLGKAPRPNEAGYEAYMNYVAQYADNDKAHQLFYDYVRFIIGRKNRYTSLNYKDDPAIMAWQIGNEPRAFSDAQKQPFAKWLSEASALIRSLDDHHLISVGSEGIWGCEMDSALYVQISSAPNIDYLNAHVWPYNWQWAHQQSLLADVEEACVKTQAYLQRHFQIARSVGKPLVIEEFGYPRDGFVFTPGSATKARDTYYDYMFRLVNSEPTVSGCNFWGWGGEARPRHEQWQKGDDYLGDPAQEQQGLNSVFSCDSTTLNTIRKYNR